MLGDDPDLNEILLDNDLLRLEHSFNGLDASRLIHKHRSEKLDSG